jgi:hypothetical protein
MPDRKERRKRWVKGGRFAVEVEIEVIFTEEDPSEPCLRPATLRFLDEVRVRAEVGDLAYLKSVGTVYEAVSTGQP